MKKKYQFVVWFPKWKGFGKYDFPRERAMSLVYDWCVWLGFFEIRKWHGKPTKEEIVYVNSNNKKYAKGKKRNRRNTKNGRR